MAPTWDYCQLQVYGANLPEKGAELTEHPKVVDQVSVMEEEDERFDVDFQWSKTVELFEPYDLDGRILGVHMSAVKAVGLAPC